MESGDAVCSKHQFLQYFYSLFTTVTGPCLPLARTEAPTELRKAAAARPQDGAASGQAWTGTTHKVHRRPLERGARPL